MIRKYIKLIIAGILVVGAVALFIQGIIGWGIWAVIIAGLFVLFYFKNEMNLLAFLFIRRNKYNVSDSILNKVKHPENMIKRQEGYYYFLTGLVETQKNNRSKAEKSFKKALSSGLKMKNDRAIAMLNLSGIYLSQRNKKLSRYYLQEAKKLDEHKMLKDQVKEIEYMMKRM